jgi:glycopeptide antibiotics resistance protein
MIRLLMTSTFLAVLLWWLQYEFKRSVSLTRYWRWVVAALAAQVLASAVFMLNDGRAGNFVLHAVGGGVASTLLFLYLTRTYKLRMSWRVQLVALYAFVSSLGVLNELAEYVYEMLGLGTLSFDSHDTWRDLVANTTGAILAWSVYRLCVAVSRRPD